MEETFQPMNLKNLVWRQSEDQALHFLVGKQIDEKRSVYLVLPLDDEKPNFFLVNVEYLDDDKFKMWSYKEADSEDIVLELLEEYLETALDDI